MADLTRSELRRALEDMNRGLRAALGFDASRPDLVSMLLDPDPDAADPSGAGARSGPPARRGGVGPVPRRRRRTARSHLALVERAD